LKGSRRDYMTEYELEELISRLESEMRRVAKDLDFEKAAHLRDEIRKLKDELKAIK